MAVARYIMIVYTIRLSANFQSKTHLFKEALSWSPKKPQLMTQFYLARRVSVTSKQELQTSGISSRAVNIWEFNKKPELSLKV